MKKLVALMLALMLTLSCAFASAESIYTKVAIDSDVAHGLISMFSDDENAAASIDPIIALVNALGTKLTLGEGGGQLDFDLNDKDALSLGFSANESGIAVASTLFPNYLLTVSMETISQLMEQVAANMPSTGDEGFDPNAMAEIFGGYFQRWFEAVSAAGQPGEAVSGEYEFGGYKFDTMVPITVDIPAIAEATKTLMDELLADPAAMAAIKGMVQNAAKSSGEDFDEANFEDEFKKGFEEWISHFPEQTTAEFYCNADSEGIPFYLEGESTWGENSLTYYMLLVDEKNLNMGFNVADGEEDLMEGGFAMADSSMSAYFEMAGMYFGVACAAAEDTYLVDLYVLNEEQPLVSISVTLSDDSDITLSTDPEGKTVLSVEEIMNDKSGDAVGGLMGDIMANGLGTLLSAASEAVPELSSLMGAFMGN